MSDTRRDFLKFAASGAGSLAALGLGTDAAQACCWKSSSRRRRPGYPAPDIDFPTPTNNSDIARTFTVYGSYYYEGTPMIECKLWKTSVLDLLGTVTHSATSGLGTWMADFTVPAPPDGGTTGYTLTARLLGTNEVHEATNLTLFSDLAVPPNPPITIGNPGSRIVKAKIKKHAKPEGIVNDPRITSVWVTYVHKGEPLHDPHKAELIPEQGRIRQWKVRGGGHIDLTPHKNKTIVACVVEALIESEYGIKRFLVSDHTNTIES